MEVSKKINSEFAHHPAKPTTALANQYSPTVAEHICSDPANKPIGGKGSDSPHPSTNINLLLSHRCGAGHPNIVLPRYPVNYDNYSRVEDFDA